MSIFDYLLALVAILVGLAIGDLTASLHRLLRARSRVRWHWLPLSGALLVALVSVEVWFSVRSLERDGVALTLGIVLLLLATLVTLFLLASSALPDEVPPEGLDLQGYYFENHRYYWTLFATLVGTFVAIRLAWAGLLLGADAVLRVLVDVVPNLVLIALAISLVVVRHRWWHATWLAIVPVVYVLQLATRPLR